MPADGSNSANFWMDLQVDTNPPAGASYRLWPNYPVLPGVASDTVGYTLATEFQLSQSCTLDNIWFYSSVRRGGAADPVRDLERQLADRGLRHRQHLAVLVGRGRIRLGLVRLQRRDAARRGLQGGGVLRRRIQVVPGHDQLLGQRRSRRQRDHRRPTDRPRPVQRDKPRPEHL